MPRYDLIPKYPAPLPTQLPDQIAGQQYRERQGGNQQEMINVETVSGHQLQMSRREFYDPNFQESIRKAGGQVLENAPGGRFTFDVSQRDGKGFFENPQRVGRYMDLVKNAPPNWKPPDWLKVADLKEAYDYLKYRNGDNPDWLKWGGLPEDDPGTQFMRSMAPPPQQFLWPSEQEYAKQQAQQDGGYTINDPSQQRAEWKDLDPWQQWYLSVNAPQAPVPGMPEENKLLAAGLQGGIGTGLGAMGLTIGAGVVGGLIGGALIPGVGAIPGAMAGLTFASQIAPWVGLGAAGLGTYESYTGEQAIPGGAQVMNLFNVLSEATKRSIGIGMQINAQGLDPVVGSLDKALASWKAAQATYATLAPSESGFDPDIINSFARIAQWIPGSGVTEEDQAKANQFWAIGQGYRLPVSTNEPRNADAQIYLREELLKRDLTDPKEAEAFIQEFMQKFGDTAAANDFLYSTVLDPTTFIPFLETKMGGSLARKMGDARMIEAYKMAEGSPLVDLLPPGVQQAVELLTNLTDRTAGDILSRQMSDPKLYKRMMQRYYGQRSTTGTVGAMMGYKSMVQGGYYPAGTPEAIRTRQANELTSVEKLFAGLDSEGRIKEVMPRTPNANPLVRGLQNLASLTPESQAQMMLEMFKDNLGVTMNMAGGDPANMVDYLGQLMNADPTKVNEIGRSVYNSPIAATIRSALQSANQGDYLQNMLSRYTTVQPARMELMELARRMELEPSKILDMVENDATSLAAMVRKVDPASPWANPDYLSKAFGVFVGKDATPWSPEEFQYRLTTGLSDKMDQYLATAYNLKPDHWIFRMSNVLKGMQSLALLGFNPGYWLANESTNMFTRIMDGVGGFMSPRAINEAMDRFGITPARMREGFGAAGDEFGQAGRPAIAKAMDANDVLQWARDGLRKVNRLAPFTRLSGMSEQNHSAQATVIGINRFWDKAWRPGVGYRKMAPALEAALDGLRPGMTKEVYNLVNAGMNMQEIETSIFNDVLKPRAETVLDDALDAIMPDMDKAVGRQLLKDLGIMDQLSKDLAAAVDPQAIDNAFDRVEAVIDERIREHHANQLIGDAQEAANLVQAERIPAVLQLHGDLEIEVGSFWISKRMEWDQLYAKRDTFESRDAWRSAVRSLSARQDAEWKRMWEHRIATYKGIIDALGQSANPQAKTYLEQLGRSSKVWSDFNASKTKLYEDYYTQAKRKKGESFDQYARRADMAYSELLTQLDEMYLKATDAEKSIEIIMDASFARMYSDFTGWDPGEAATWRQQLRDVRYEMVQAQMAMRERTKGMDSDARDAAYQEFNQVYNSMIARMKELEAEGAMRLSQSQGPVQQVNVPPAAPRPGEAGQPPEAPPPAGPGPVNPPPPAAGPAPEPSPAGEPGAPPRPTAPVNPRSTITQVQQAARRAGDFAGGEKHQLNSYNKWAKETGLDPVNFLTEADPADLMAWSNARLVRKAADPARRASITKQFVQEVTRMGTRNERLARFQQAGFLTRKAAVMKMQDSFKLTNNQVAATRTVIDLVADRWAQQMGFIPNEGTRDAWYGAHIVEIERLVGAEAEGEDIPYNARASVAYIDDGRAIIRGYEQADVSSLMHEMGHMFRRDLPDADINTLALMGGFDNAAHYRATEVRFDRGNKLYAEAYNLRGLETRTPEQEARLSYLRGLPEVMELDRFVQTEETFARGWEKYLAEGDAPTPQLQSLFARFTDWMIKVYEGLKRYGGRVTGLEGQAAFSAFGAPIDIRTKINGRSLQDIFDEMIVERASRPADSLALRVDRAQTAIARDGTVTEQVATRALDEVIRDALEAYPTRADAFEAAKVDPIVADALIIHDNDPLRYKVWPDPKLFQGIEPGTPESVPWFRAEGDGWSTPMEDMLNVEPYQSEPRGRSAQYQAMVDLTLEGLRPGAERQYAQDMIDWVMDGADGPKPDTVLTDAGRNKIERMVADIDDVLSTERMEARQILTPNGEQDIPADGTHYVPTYAFTHGEVEVIGAVYHDGQLVAYRPRNLEANYHRYEDGSYGQVRVLGVDPQDPTRWVYESNGRIDTVNQANPAEKTGTRRNTLYQGARLSLEPKTYAQHLAALSETQSDVAAQRYITRILEPTERSTALQALWEANPKQADWVYRKGLGTIFTTLDEPSGWKAFVAEIEAVPNAAEIMEPQNVAEFAAHWSATAEGIDTEMAAGIGQLIKMRANAINMHPDDYVRQYMGFARFDDSITEGKAVTYKLRGDAQDQNLAYIKEYVRNNYSDQDYNAYSQGVWMEYNRLIKSLASAEAKDANGKPVRSPIRGNTKTLLSLDFSGNCPFRKTGIECPQCYVRSFREGTTELGQPGSPNPVFDGTPYQHDILRLTEIKLIDPTTGEVRYPMVEALNSQGGMRVFSIGDYQEVDRAGLMAAAEDAASIGLDLKLITKQAESIEALARYDNVKFDFSADFDEVYFETLINQAAEAMSVQKGEKVPRVMARDINAVMVRAKIIRDNGWDPANLTKEQTKVIQKEMKKIADVPTPFTPEEVTRKTTALKDALELGRAAIGKGFTLDMARRYADEVDKLRAYNLWANESGQPRINSYKDLTDAMWSAVPAESRVLPPGMATGFVRYVGMNRAEIARAAMDPRIDVVTSYHGASGNTMGRIWESSNVTFIREHPERRNRQLWLESKYGPDIMTKLQDAGFDTTNLPTDESMIRARRGLRATLTGEDLETTHPAQVENDVVAYFRRSGDQAAQQATLDEIFGEGNVQLAQWLEDMAPFQFYTMEELIGKDAYDALQFVFRDTGEDVILPWVAKMTQEELNRLLGRTDVTVEEWQEQIKRKACCSTGRCFTCPAACGQGRVGGKLGGMDIVDKVLADENRLTATFADDSKTMYQILSSNLELPQVLSAMMAMFAKDPVGFTPDEIWSLKASIVGRELTKKAPAKVGEHTLNTADFERLGYTFMSWLKSGVIPPGVDAAGVTAMRKFGDWMTTSLATMKKPGDYYGLPAAQTLTDMLTNLGAEKTARRREMRGRLFQGGDTLWTTPTQEISSAATSINSGKIPATFNRVEWTQGMVNADIGGGRFDNATEFLASKGAENVIYDPFNRTPEQNAAAVAKIRGGQADTATINNVLNVIQDPAARAKVVTQAADAIRPDGTAYFMVYEGDKSGQPKATKAGWQENRAADTYMDEIKAAFREVTRSGNLITAKRPIKEGRSRLFQVTPQQAAETNVPIDISQDASFRVAVGNTKGAQITEDGLVLDTVRYQKEEQAGQTSVRTGVFYLTAGDKKASAYKSRYVQGIYGERRPVNNYGGDQQMTGRTVFRHPLPVEGATGGAVPERALTMLVGKTEADKIKAAVTEVTDYYARVKGSGYGPDRMPRQPLINKIDDFIHAYGEPDIVDAGYIMETSGMGNLMRYALFEMAVIKIAREAGYDGIIGIGNTRKRTITEVIDTREITYPSEYYDASIHPRFYEKSESVEPVSKDYQPTLFQGTDQGGPWLGGDLVARTFFKYNETDVMRKAAFVAEDGRMVDGSTDLRPDRKDTEHSEIAAEITGLNQDNWQQMDQNLADFMDQTGMMRVAYYYPPEPTDRLAAIALQPSRAITSRQARAIQNAVLADGAEQVNVQMEPSGRWSMDKLARIWKKTVDTEDLARTLMAASRSEIPDANGLRPKLFQGEDQGVFRKKTADMTPEELRYVATHDELTGLKNRRAFKEDPRRPFVLIADVEGLKFINDQYGHEAGDQVVLAVARSITEVAGDDNSYRGSDRGDEVIGQFETEAQAREAGVRLKAVVDGQKIQVAGEDTQGLGIAYGVGRDLNTADLEMNRTKDADVREGRRAQRGEKPKKMRQAGQAPTDPMDPVGLPLGTTPVRQNQAQMLGQVNDETVRPVLSKMRELAKARTGGKEILGQTMTPDVRGQVENYLRAIQGDMSSTKFGAMRYGQEQRDFTLLNYNRRYGFDQVAQLAFPYQFFFTRSMANWGKRMLNKPAWFAMWARMKEMQEENTNTIMPSRLRGKVRIPMPFLPEWTGGGLYVDPWKNVFLPDSFFKPVEQMVLNRTKVERRAEQILKEMADADRMTLEEYNTAIQSKKGPQYEIAMAAAEKELDVDSSPASLVGMMTSPGLWLSIPDALARGKPEKISPFPLTKTASAYQAALKGTALEGVGRMIGLGAAPENYVRAGAGLSEFGQWGDYYIDRMLANMAADGDVSAEEAQTAMIQRSGEAFDTAKERVSYETMLRTPGALTANRLASGDLAGASESLINALFGGALLPEGELKQRGLSQVYNKAWAARKAGDDQAINKFFDEHPEYSARLALYDKPEERLRQFLISSVWDRYSQLGKADKTIATQQMGPEFETMMLDKNTRAYDAIDVKLLATWSRFLGGMLPKVPEVEGVENVPEYQALPEGVNEAVTAYSKERSTRFPNYYAIQQGYYAKPKGSARAEYLARFPQLKKYWEWNTRYKNAHQEMQPYYDAMAPESAPVLTPGEIQGLQYGPLLQELMSYWYTGQRLTTGARMMVDKLKTAAGRDMTTEEYMLYLKAAAGAMSGEQPAGNGLP